VRLPRDNRGFGNDPLLRVGLILMAFALVFAIVTAVLTVLLRNVPEQAAASEKVATTKPSAGPLIRGESSVKPWREQARHIPTPEDSKDEANPEPSGGGPKPGFAAAPGAKEGSRPGPLPQPGQETRAELEARPEPEPAQRTPILGESGWQRPTQREIEAANGPRHYDLPAGAVMSLTIDSIGIYGAPVFDSASPTALANGIAHLPDTSWPWSPTPQRNVYLAGHRMGFRGTWSRMLFYNLDKLGKGDKVVLRDRQGRTYAYRVSETFLAEPTDRWVTGQVRGRDILTLQTCTPIPTFEKRLIVRADRL
jgi:sortase A